MKIIVTFQADLIAIIIFIVKELKTFKYDLRDINNDPKPLTYLFMYVHIF